MKINNQHKNILVIKLRHHGDVLLTTPTLEKLSSIYPESSIDVLLYKETTPILDKNELINNIFHIDRTRKGIQKVKSTIDLIRNLRKKNYDLVIHLSDQGQGAFIAWAAGKNTVIGFDYPKRRGTHWSRFFTHLAPVANSNTIHTVEQNLMALKPLGIDYEHDLPGMSLQVSEESKIKVQHMLSTQGISTPYIAVHPASRWFFKCWEDERFAQVIQTLADQGWPIVLTSAPDSKELALIASIVRQTNSEKIISLAGKLTLPDLAAVIVGSRLFIGVDSVPMHMAAALKKDTVALFGPSKVNEWRPWMTRYVLINAADFGPLIDPDDVDTSTTERYLKNIPITSVLEAVHNLLENKKEN
ncbi:putative lipopolysaccharide heptosyltransferase III [Aquitalea sp. S1-19]|nr:putative lipopolysaccharide heptosyltransferase III [Aquitalea sp. S1-19]